ncbi:MAG: 23S rRNA (guanosine(2251)-2'-O)-methyltransferase RlmB [Oscillospiraceae bacterium]|nr:23S rRNA (guanosine(2251)-2'-O)-methyltransferase RlmB [Oscillospiraceae bacterium]
MDNNRGNGYNRDRNRNYSGNNRSGRDNRDSRSNFNSDRNRFSGNKSNYNRDNSNNSFKNSGGFKRNDGAYKSERSNFSNNSNNSNKFDKRDNFDRFNKFKRSDNNGYNKNKFERNERSERPAPSDRFGKSDRFNKSEKFDRNDRPAKFKKFSNNAGKSERFNRFERSEKPDRFNTPTKFNNFKRNENDNFEKRSGNFDDKSNKYINNKVNKPRRSDDINNIKESIQLPNVIVENVEQEDSGMVYGRNAVIELLKSGKSIDKIYVQSGQREGSITMIFAEAIRKSIPVIEVEKQKLDSMINNSGHQGVIALASEKEYCSVDDILNIAKEKNQKPFILIADKIMDPHNLGALIRTAECAGVHGIIIPKRNACGVSPIVAKTSAGASVHMAIAKVANIANTIEELKEKGVWIFSSTVPVPEALGEIDGDENEVRNYSDTDLDYSLPLVLVVGNEGEGLSPIVIQKSDFLIKIPVFGEIESLNVSCASAILMYEISNRRGKS